MIPRRQLLLQWRRHCSRAWRGAGCSPALARIIRILLLLLLRILLLLPLLEVSWLHLLSAPMLALLYRLTVLDVKTPNLAFLLQSVFLLLVTVVVLN